MTKIDKAKLRHSLLHALQRTENPLSIPEIDELLGGDVSHYTLRRLLLSLADEGLVTSVGEKTARRWLRRSTPALAVQSQPESVPEPRVPLFVMEVYADGVVITHEDAAKILGGFNVG